MRTMTIRNITLALSTALEDEKRHRGLSMNRTVLELLRQGLGISDKGPRSNGLAEQAGSWNDEELERFEQATAQLGQVDEDLWR